MVISRGAENLRYGGKRGQTRKVSCGKERGSDLPNGLICCTNGKFHVPMAAVRVSMATISGHLTSSHPTSTGPNDLAWVWKPCPPTDYASIDYACRLSIDALHLIRTLKLPCTCMMPYKSICPTLSLVFPADTLLVSPPRRL